MSRDPWRSTNTDELHERLDPWEQEEDSVLLATTKRSAIGDHEIEGLKKKFGNRFCHIDFDTDSCFGMVYDTQKTFIFGTTH